MASLVAQLADAVVTALRAVEWSGVPFVVRRTFKDCRDEQFTASERYDAEVAVLVPDAYETVELGTRGSLERTVVVTLIVRRRFQQNEQEQDTGEIQPEQIDEMIELAELLSTATVYERLAGFDGDAAIVTPVEHDPIYSREHLRSLRQFTSVINLTFEITTSL